MNIRLKETDSQSFKLFGALKITKASKLGKCHVCAAVDESYTIAQWLAHLSGKQKVPGSNPGYAACHFSTKLAK